MKVYGIISVANSHEAYKPHALIALEGKLYHRVEYTLDENGNLQAVPNGDSLGDAKELEEQLLKDDIAKVGDLRVYVDAHTGHGQYETSDRPVPKYQDGTIYYFPWNIRGIDKVEDLVGRVVKTDKGLVKIRWIRRNNALPSYFPMGELVSPV